MSLTELLITGFIAVCFVLLIGVPAGIICRRIGRSPWLGALALLPIANIAVLWFVAVGRWETEPVGSGAA